ncbi:hypothetical protein D9M73_207880 [compost metagenome]
MLDEFWNPAKWAVGGDTHTDKRCDATSHGPGLGLSLIEYGDDVFGGPFQAHAGRAESELSS